MILQLTETTEADDYFKDVSSSKVHSRALLLNTVVYGKAQKLYHTDTSVNSLESGFHSVSTRESYSSRRLIELIYWFCLGDGSSWRRSQL